MYAGVVFNGSGNTVGNIEIWEEPSLRLWHVQDPPDARERARNAAIEVAQGSRNPFIDYPHLVDRIANF
jgi:deoxyribonuclease-1